VRDNPGYIGVFLLMPTDKFLYCRQRQRMNPRAQGPPVEDVK
jgi:hypothetical protein